MQILDKSKEKNKIVSRSPPFPCSGPPQLCFCVVFTYRNAKFDIGKYPASKTSGAQLGFWLGKVGPTGHRWVPVGHQLGKFGQRSGKNWTMTVRWDPVGFELGNVGKFCPYNSHMNPRWDPISWVSELISAPLPEVCSSKAARISLR